MSSYVLYNPATGKFVVVSSSSTAMTELEAAAEVAEKSTGFRKPTYEELAAGLGVEMKRNVDCIQKNKEFAQHQKELDAAATELVQMHKEMEAANAKLKDKLAVATGSLKKIQAERDSMEGIKARMEALAAKYDALRAKDDALLAFTKKQQKEAAAKIEAGIDAGVAEQHEKLVAEVAKLKQALVDQDATLTKVKDERKEWKRRFLSTKTPTKPEKRAGGSGGGGGSGSGGGGGSGSGGGGAKKKRNRK
jgi:chromosome segregation ATPase